MTVREAAARLGLAENAVYQLLLSRRLGHRKIGPSGGRYQITEQHIEEYLTSCEVPRAGAKKPKPKPKTGGPRGDGRPLRYDW